MLLTLVDIVIAVLALESVLLLALRRNVLLDIGPHLMAGLALLLALRGALAGAGLANGAFYLLLAGLAHGAALWQETRRTRA